MSSAEYLQTVAVPDSRLGAPARASVVAKVNPFSLQELKLHALRAERRLCRWTACYGLLLTRISLGIVFLWFGALKFLPAPSPIDALAEKTIAMLTFHLVSPLVSLHILAVWECLIGVGLLVGVYLRAALLLLFLHLPGTFLPLVLLPHACWTSFPLSPTLAGHYILKNMVLLSAGIVIAASSRGGRIIADPELAKEAARLELLLEDEPRFPMRVVAGPRT